MLRIALMFTFGLLCTAPEAASLTVTDALQRQVTLPGPAQRIVLAESRHVVALSLLLDDPVARIVAWGDDLPRYSPGTWQAVTARFPTASEIPLIGATNAGTFSLEAAIASRPDLIVFGLYGAPPQGLERLEAAHIPYVFIDFFREPDRQTVPSMRLLGQVLGREAQADAFIALFQKHMDDVAYRLENIQTPVNVFFHINPGAGECCTTTGRSKSGIIRTAGGVNLVENRVSGAVGRINPELLLAEQPDFYLIGGGSSVARNGLLIGPGVSRKEAAQSLMALLQAPTISALNAVRQERVAGVWLFLFDSPLWFLGVEAIACQLHPEQFSDVDPDETLNVLNQRYLAFPLTGTLWIGAAGKGSGASQ